MCFSSHDGRATAGNIIRMSKAYKSCFFVVLFLPCQRQWTAVAFKQCHFRPRRVKIPQLRDIHESLIGGWVWEKEKTWLQMWTDPLALLFNPLQNTLARISCGPHQAARAAAQVLHILNYRDWMHEHTYHCAWKHVCLADARQKGQRSHFQTTPEGIAARSCPLGRLKVIGCPLAAHINGRQTRCWLYGNSTRAS